MTQNQNQSKPKSGSFRATYLIPFFIGFALAIFAFGAYLGFMHKAEPPSISFLPKVERENLHAEVSKLINQQVEKEGGVRVDVRSVVAREISPEHAVFDVQYKFWTAMKTGEQVENSVTTLISIGKKSGIWTFEKFKNFKLEMTY